MKRKLKPSDSRSIVSIDLLKELALEDLGNPPDEYLTSDMSPEYASRVMMKLSLWKKFQGDEHEDAARRAIDKFLVYNEHCRNFRLQANCLKDELLINEVTSLIDKWLHPDGVPISYGNILRNAALGGGSSMGSSMNDLYTKLFNSPLTAYSQFSQELYARATLGNPSWADAEKARFSTFGNEVVGASRLTTVRKQFDIKRTICSEPVADMFFQRGIGVCTDWCLGRALGYDGSRQPDRNRMLAMLGSLFQTFGTVDSRSASDCVSLGLEPIFPRYYWRMLMAHRSSSVVLPDGRVEKLYMVSSMGNGYTFSLETLVFSAIVNACYRLSNLHCSFRDSIDGKSVVPTAGVFGDDIVVDFRVYDFVLYALKLFGFHVNDDKSYNSGHFRESCGEDYFKGVNVRGVYLKRLSSVTDCYSAINRLVSWSLRTQNDLDLSLSYLLASVPLRYVPFSEQDYAGIKVPEYIGADYYCINTRSPFYRAHSAIVNHWTPPGSKKDRKRNRHGAQKHPTYKHNPSGLYLSFLHGTVREGRVGIRSEDDLPIRTKVLQRLIPNWDYLPSARTFWYGLPGWQTRVAELITRLVR